VGTSDPTNAMVGLAEARELGGTAFEELDVVRLARAEDIEGPPGPVRPEARPPHPPPGPSTIEQPPAPPPPDFVYAIGRVDVRFGDLDLEREFAQVVSTADTSGLTDQGVMHAVLSRRENRYLARRACWVFSVASLPTYLLVPRDPGDFELLIQAVRSRPSPSDLDVLIGMKGPLASGDACNGLVVPVVAFDQLYSFDRAALIEAIPRDSGAPVGEFEAASEELLDRILQLADNAGGSREHRALNYLAVRYPAIYGHAVEANQRELSLSAVEVRGSRLSGVREIVDVIFSYTHRRSQVVDKVFTRVDITGEFPFLISRLQPYYDR
jgi:hypothetical protein